MSPNAAYKPSSLVKRKGKWYVAVTKPMELQFGTDRQVRRSTGTTDKRQAEHLQHDLTREIYEQFDRQLERSDKVFEALRPILEAEGIETRQWYQKGTVEVTLRGERASLARMAGGEVRYRKGNQTARIVEKLEAESHFDLCWLVTMLGHSVPARVLGMLSEEERALVLKASHPTEPDTDQVLDIAETFPRPIAKSLVDHVKTTTTIKLDTPLVIENSSAPSLAMVVDEYLKTRPERSRNGDRLQLNKWLNHRYGSKPLKEVDQYDAHEFLTEMGETLAKSSIGVLKAAMSNVFRWTMTKRELDIRSNPFSGLDLSHIGRDGIERRPFTFEELHTLFALDMRPADKAALAILVSTGMRGGELMSAKEVKTLDDIRYLDLVDEEVKTQGSRRRVPLHDALEDLRLPLTTSQDRLNRIIREKFPDPRVTLHSLRHTFKDLARDADIPKELSDFITGHAQGDVASGYGEGPSLKKRHEAIMSIKHPWLGW